MAARWRRPASVASLLDRALRAAAVLLQFCSAVPGSARRRLPAVTHALHPLTTRAQKLRYSAFFSTLKFPSACRSAFTA
jgi:hypothetical protein